MPKQFDIFISFKNTDAAGRPTRDSELALECHDFLAAKGFNVFCSAVTLENQGIATYKRAIDEALDQATVLIAVGVNAENLDSEWVRYEWDSFFNDILSRRKKNARIFVYLEGADPSSLPRTLRQMQVVTHGPGGLEQLHRFIANSLQTGSPETSHIAPGASTETRASPISSAAPDIDLLAKQATLLLEAGNHRGAVSLLTQQVQRYRADKNNPGQAMALIELAHIVSRLPGENEAALKLARKALVICSNYGLKDLERDSAELAASIQRNILSAGAIPLSQWIRSIVNAEPTYNAKSQVSAPPVGAGTSVGQDGRNRTLGLVALEGAWQSVLAGDTSVPVDYYAKVIDRKLWVPYSWGSTGTLSALYYGFVPSGDGWNARFKWKDSVIAGFSIWKTASPDAISSEWWASDQIKEMPTSHRPNIPGTRMTMKRANGRSFPSWAEEVFDEIRNQGSRSTNPS